VHDVLAHGLEYRQGGVEVGLVTADHEGQGAGGGAAGATGYRRVDQAVATGGGGLGYLTGAHGVDGGAVDQAHMRSDVGQQAVFAQVDTFHVGRCGQHGDDHLDVAAGQFGDAGGGGGTGFDQAGDGALGEVGYGELMPCLEQVPGHRPAHVTQSYKANFHVVASLLLSGGWACWARRSRRGGPAFRRRSYNVLGTATPLWEPCLWAKGCSLGVLCTPFAAGALLLHPSVGALPVGERAVPWACWARRSQRGRCSYIPLWEPRPRGEWRAARARSVVLEVRLALLDEGLHALGLVGGGEDRVEHPTLEAHAFGQTGLEYAVDAFLGHHHARE